MTLKQNDTHVVSVESNRKINNVVNGSYVMSVKSYCIIIC